MAASSSLDHLSNRMKLEWFSKLNTEMVPMKNFRRTSIIGTIGMFFLPGGVWPEYAPENFSQVLELTCNVLFQVPKPTILRRSTRFAEVLYARWINTGRMQG